MAKMNRRHLVTMFLVCVVSSIFGSWLASPVQASGPPAVQPVPYTAPLLAPAAAGPRPCVKPCTNKIAVVGSLPSSWNLPTVMKDWSASPYVELFPARSCTGHVRCIKVTLERLCCGNIGEADIGWTPYGQRAIVNLDPYKANTVYKKKAVTCHEIGHALTNYAHPNDGSCLRYYVGSGDLRWPGVAGLRRAR